MNQRIKFEQLQELSEEQQLALMKWWKPEPGDIYFSPTEKGEYKRYGCYIWHGLSPDQGKKLPLLSVGQMIDFLYSHKAENQPFYFEYHEEEWYINNGRIYREMTLVGVLWLAVKDILQEG